MNKRAFLKLLGLSGMVPLEELVRAATAMNIPPPKWLQRPGLSAANSFVYLGFKKRLLDEGFNWRAAKLCTALIDRSSLGPIADYYAVSELPRSAIIGTCDMENQMVLMDGSGRPHVQAGDCHFVNCKVGRWIDSILIFNEPDGLLIAHINQGFGMPCLTAGDIVISWDRAHGIFSL